LLVDQWGTLAAKLHAAERADAMFVHGDMDGKVTWLAILRAI
jgi:hypothetical protein